MDRLEEIRQRCEAAKAQKEKGDRVTATCIAWSIVTNDTPYLLSEVDRLNALHRVGHDCKIEEIPLKSEFVGTMFSWKFNK